MDERKLLSALLKSQKVWETVKDEVDKKDFSPEAAIIFDLVNDFYSGDKDAKCCDVDILLARAQRSISSNKVSDVIVGAIKALAAIDASAVNVGKEVLELKKASLGNRIAAKFASGKTGPELKDWMTEFMRLDEVEEGLSGTTETEEEFVGIKATELSKTAFSNDGLIHLYPKALNDQIDGGIRGGHHLLVFAPVEMGKTLVTINFCFGFLRQNLRVLYVCNEEPPQDIMMRMMSRLTGMNKHEIMDNPARADELLAKRNWNLFTVASLAPGTFPRIRRLIEKYNPQVLVLDQLRNIDVDSENRTQSLEKAATEARNTAKRFNIPVVSVTQAADSASGKSVLNRGDVDGSNVGIPAQADLMLGVGATQEMEERNIRMLSLVKNKLSGIHTPIQIQIDPFLSRVVE